MKNIIISIKVFVVLMIITGVVYPLFITGVALGLFPNQAKGGIVLIGDKTVGAKLIGQSFTNPAYFWGRPSSINNNPAPSGASNLSPKSDALKDLVKARLDTIQKYHGNVSINQIPQDLLFASASGVDPEISPEAAFFQVDRIAKYRNLNQVEKQKLIELINKSIIQPDLFILGESRVNVVKLNIELCKL